jgi:PAS domain S-box-containing protein
VNVPIIFFDKHLGSVGMGTFGDEGVRVPTKAEEEYLRALASHLAVTLDRIHLLAERKKAEQEIRKLNRIYRMLSDCSQSLVRADNENKLIAEVCRIITEEGGYRMVWVGYPQNDEDKTVKPVAFAGYEDGYLNQRRFSWGDNEYGRGPTGKAIRTGKYVTALNYNTDPTFAPWKEEAQKRGYASSAAFPLITDGKPFGALSIYGGASDVFSKEELTLLQELAFDLAYGIATIRTRIERERAQAMLNDAQRIAHVGSWHMDLATNEVFWSEELYRLYGFDPAFPPPLYTESMKLFTPESWERLSTSIAKTAETGTSYELELETTAQTDRGRKWMLARGEPVRDARGAVVGVRGMVMDITQRKWAEQEIRHANAYNRSLIEVSLDPLVTISPEGKITDVNAATEAVTGRSRSELIGTDFSDYFSEPEKAKAGYHQVFEAGFVKDYPLEIKDKEGNLTPVIYNASVYRDEEGKITGVFAAARDVTEQKRAEQEILKLNRIYRTLSACNESLVRTKDENELVSNTCKIIVDEGGYRLVWVGYAQDDEDKTIKPVAYAGHEDGYLSQMKFSWGDNKYGYAASSVAIKENKYHVIPDFSADTTIMPWKEEAMKRGYATNVAFPLVINGKPMGALIIYGSAAGAFNQDEILLLSELASDLSYGISTIRTRIEREHVQVMLNEAQRITHIGSWELDLINNVLTWSDEIYRMFEIDPAKFGASYEAFLDAIHPDDREAVNFAYTNSLKTKLPYSIDHRLLFHDGRMKYVHEHCETYYDDDGKPLRSVGTVQDVTERKLAEEAFMNLSQKNELILNAAGEGIYGTDTEGNITFVNPAAAKMLGFPIEELIGKNSHHVFHHTKADGQPYPISECPLYKSLREGGIHRGENEVFWTKAGKKFDVEHVNTPLLEAGKVVGAVVVFSDITERKLVQEALRHAYAYNRSLIEASLDPLVTISPEGKITDVNAATEIVTGHPRNELIGTDFSDYFSEPEKAKAGYHQVFEVGFVKDYSLNIRHKDGHLTPVVYNASIYRDEKDQITGVFAAARDITKLKAAEMALHELNDKLELLVKQRTSQLEAANKELEAFTYSVSHDLRAPLRAIDGFSAAVMEDYGNKVGEDGKDYLQRVRNASQKMSTLIDDLLSLSRLTRGELNKTSANLSNIASDVIKILREAEPDRNVEVNISENMMDEADPHFMEIVFTNLLNNAWKFTSKKEKAKIEFNFTEKDGKKIYYIRDNGAGFDMQYAAKLFQPFQRLHTVEEFPGTGIGLATVYRIIKKHGGEIWAEGKVDEGATFYFTLGG